MKGKNSDKYCYKTKVKKQAFGVGLKSTILLKNIFHSQKGYFGLDERSPHVV